MKLIPNQDVFYFFIEKKIFKWVTWSSCVSPDNILPYFWLPPLSIIHAEAIKKPTPIHPHTHTLLHAPPPFLGTGIMDCVPVHPYFSDVSLVSLYISSVAAAWRIRLLLKHVCVADPLTGVVRHNRLSRVGQREPRQHLRHFSSASQIIHKHLKVHRPSHEPHLCVWPTVFNAGDSHTLLFVCHVAYQMCPPTERSDAKDQLLRPPTHVHKSTWNLLRGCL